MLCKPSSVSQSQNVWEPDHKDAHVQGMGNMFARNVKVNMEDMRKAQFEAATIVLRRQLSFLRHGSFPDLSAPDTSIAPIGSVEERLDEQSLAIRAIPKQDEDGPVPLVHGQLRLRRTVKYKGGRGGHAQTRTIYYSNRDNIFVLNSLCEKWVGLKLHSACVNEAWTAFSRRCTVACHMSVCGPESHKGSTRDEAYRSSCNVFSC
jgi:hypothetical protein